MRKPLLLIALIAVAFLAISVNVAYAFSWDFFERVFSPFTRFVNTMSSFFGGGPVFEEACNNCECCLADCSDDWGVTVTNCYEACQHYWGPQYVGECAYPTSDSCGECCSCRIDLRGDCSEHPDHCGEGRSCVDNRCCLNDDRPGCRRPEDCCSNICENGVCVTSACGDGQVTGDEVCDVNIPAPCSDASEGCLYYCVDGIGNSPRSRFCSRDCLRYEDLCYGACDNWKEGSSGEAIEKGICYTHYMGQRCDRVGICCPEGQVCDDQCQCFEPTPGEDTASIEIILDPDKNCYEPGEQITNDIYFRFNDELSEPSLKRIIMKWTEDSTWNEHDYTDDYNKVEDGHYRDTFSHTGPGSIIHEVTATIGGVQADATKSYEVQEDCVGGIGNNAKFISQTEPPTEMCTGQTAPVTILMENNGNTIWTSGDYYLGSQNPEDNTNWGTNRQSLSLDVEPGVRYLFDWTITAPSTPGEYHFQWKMVQEGVEWFGDSTPDIEVTVNLNQGSYCGGGGTCCDPYECIQIPATPFFVCDVPEGLCESDCTYSSDNICHEECEGKNGCTLLYSDGYDEKELNQIYWNAELTGNKASDWCEDSYWVDTNGDNDFDSINDPDRDDSPVRLVDCVGEAELVYSVTRNYDSNGDGVDDNCPIECENAGKCQQGTTTDICIPETFPTCTCTQSSIEYTYYSSGCENCPGDISSCIDCDQCIPSACCAQNYRGIDSQDKICYWATHRCGAQGSPFCGIDDSETVYCDLQYGMDVSESSCVIGCRGTGCCEGGLLEICDNGEDEDGDGRIDCEDPDCGMTCLCSENAATSCGIEDFCSIIGCFGQDAKGQCVTCDLNDDEIINAVDFSLCASNSNFDDCKRNEDCDTGYTCDVKCQDATGQNVGECISLCGEPACIQSCQNNGYDSGYCIGSIPSGHSCSGVSGQTCIYSLYNNGLCTEANTCQPSTFTCWCYNRQDCSPDCSSRCTDDGCTGTTTTSSTTSSTTSTITTTTTTSSTTSTITTTTTTSSTTSTSTTTTIQPSCDPYSCCGCHKVYNEDCECAITVSGCSHFCGWEECDKACKENGYSSGRCVSGQTGGLCGVGEFKLSWGPPNCEKDVDPCCCKIGAQGFVQEISIQCNKQIPSQTISCHAVNCNSGLWVVTNYDGNPLDYPIVSDYVPNQEIKFTPNRIGKVKVIFICLDPYVEIKKSIVEV